MKQAKAKQQTATNKAPGDVRVISGKWRGRKLPVFDAEGLRPTPDRVKETLFNWLMLHIDGAIVLDCFAGSGSLAIEALSRHANYASLIERDRKLAAHLKQNLQRLSCSNAEVINQDCLTVLAKTAIKKYDIAFIDPPFHKNLAIACCQALETNGWLADNAFIYLEVEKELNIQLIPSNWLLIKHQQAGQLAYRLYQRQNHS
ncbi:16S rRNA (guanine(966)-N(2))-methyltransferase RsmD [Rheinheimera sp. MMS21-TC3]|uniref:16S rRNA (guanine(966)-N(2))-methyltransferase RsmD n=1 Tax=Rheinheimera sp. MMS21-TC3 TaxID=3072790 RepID=UPI0028C3A400|nr:16S rRNA (guanine(966)-N(2))-methyltransferase RsmD [Rheinheimera sp. MMS21-TC3]WNO60381.1 16S rRNA (guanine(966)-N(2))-methyltransferase RsmD [Rheinheimera sp. MMS21-TC3]